MSQAQLVLHRGAVEVNREALSGIQAPAPQGRWYPIKHTLVLDRVCTTLMGAGFQIVRERLAVARDGHRFFGTLDLASPLTKDGSVTLAVGVRNSTDKSFPLGFCAGNRVFVCDNLAFRSELLVKRKHTRFGDVRFGNAIASAVQSLRSWKEAESERIAQLQSIPVTDEAASHYLVRSLEAGIISSLVLPQVWKEWCQPSFDYGPPTLWRLLQSYTTVLGTRARTAPNEYAGMTIRLNALLVPRPSLQLAV